MNPQYAVVEREHLTKIMGKAVVVRVRRRVEWHQLYDGRTPEVSVGAA